MKNKKLMIILITIVAFVGILSSTVFAGHHNNRTSSKISYSKCNVSNCTTTSNHTHNGKYYYGHSNNDGHSYHKTNNNSISYSKCNVSNCTQTSNHTHNGKHYYGHSNNDGHIYHATNHGSSKHH